MEQCSYMYMMGSASRRALYTGVTATLRKRVFEHKHDLVEGFTSKYRCHRLVYFEKFTDIRAAIAREKQVKGWRRQKKDKLVEAMNPGWKDLAADWFPDTLRYYGEPV
jgi:putative endonuclease